MGFAVNAGQPTSIIGTAGASTGISMTSHVTKADINRSAENFYLKANNGKYDLDGGSLGFAESVSITTYDMRRTSNLSPGTLWKNIKFAFASEGASASSGTYGIWTATVAQMRIEQCNAAEQGGRLALDVSAKILSADGTTAPVAWAKS